MLQGEVVTGISCYRDKLLKGHHEKGQKVSVSNLAIDFGFVLLVKTG